jgi:hypothetical protein
MSTTPKAPITVVHKWARIPQQGQGGIEIVDVCKDNDWRAGLSPFSLGPVPLYDGFTATNVENAWQYSKVYEEHTLNDEPTEAYWQWAQAGWSNPIPQRYPMGRGRAPKYSLWKDQKLGYIQARKTIYGPLFLKALQESTALETLKNLWKACDHLFLRDWDGWNMQRHNMQTLTQVLNNPSRKMGHAFFIKAFLENDPMLKELQKQ